MFHVKLSPVHTKMRFDLPIEQGYSLYLTYVCHVVCTKLQPAVECYCGEHPDPRDWN